MVAANKGNQYDGEQESNTNGGNGMGIENFQQFNIRSDDGDQVALILTLQFCRAQTAQSTEHLVPDQR